MWRSIRSSQTCVIGAALLVLLAGSAARAEQVTPEKAIWKVQEIHLSYFGFTTYYSCDSLRDKVREAIEQLGAREDSLVSIAGCDELSGPARMPSVRIVMATPTAATPEAVAAQSQDQNRAALLTRMQKKGKAAQSDEPFDAVRKTVVLQTKDFVRSAAGDCELLEHIRDKIVKKMDGRVVKDGLTCVPHQGTVGNPKLQVEILAKA